DVRQGGNLRGSFRQGCGSQNITQNNPYILALLEAGQDQRNIRLARARAKSGETLKKIVARQRAFQVTVSLKRTEEVGAVEQRLTQPMAVAENQERVVQEDMIGIKKLRELRIALRDQPFHEAERLVGIRSLGQQPQQRRERALRQVRLQSCQLPLCSLGVAERSRF